MNGDNLPYQTLDVVPFTPITSEWGDGVGDDILALAAGTGLDNGAVDTPQLADGSVLPVKMNFGADSAEELGDGTTSSTSFTATLGSTPGTNPSVTVNVPSSGCVLVGVGAVLSNANNSATAYVGVALSGVNTVAAITELQHQNVSGTSSDSKSYFRTRLMTGLTPGSTTFTMQYRVSSGTGTFSNRNLFAIPIGNS